MATMTIVDLPEITLWYHDERKLVHHQIHRYPGSSMLEGVLEMGLAVMKEYGAQKWLSDDRNGGPLPKSHHDWANNVWGPKAAAAGWKYWALVPPNDLVGQMDMARLKEAYGALGVTASVFSDPYLALAWLVSV